MTAVAAGLTALLLAPPATAKPFGAVDPQPIGIEARPIVFDRENPERRAFGALTWLGGVHLVARMRAFGGWSGLAVDATGRRLLAVSDAGFWLTGTITHDGARLTGLAEARIGSLRGRDGAPYVTVADADAEAVTPVVPGNLDGKVYVGFERNHRIGVFASGPAGPGPAERYLALPPAIRRSPANAGIEGLAVLRAGRLKGTLVALTERHLDRDGNHRGWLIGGPSPGEIALVRRDGYSVTGLAALPDGGLLVLERHFAWTTGIRMRIRRIGAAAIRPGARLDGEVMIEAGPAFNIDNMEGIAVHDGPDGKPVVTLMSDDNYNLFQRTLLMQFRLDE